MAAFRLLRESYDSTESMIGDFLNDHVHHLRMRVMILCGQPLHTEYQEALSTHEDGYKAMLRWQALRSYGKWFQSVHDLLDLFESAGTFAYLDMRQHNPAAEPISVDDPSVQQDVKIARCLCDFVVQLSSARCWSQLHHTWCLPHCLAQVFLPHPEHMEDAQAFLQNVAKLLSKVDEARQADAVARGPHAKLMTELVDDLATLDWILTREILIDGAQTNWDPCHARLRETAFSIFAGSAETKNTCENCFAWLTDSCGRQGKRNVFGDATKYMYLLTSPYSDKGGSTTLKPVTDDIRMQSSGDNRSFEDLKVFNSVFQKLPLAEVTPNKIKKWRPAGYYAQRRAAAAMAFVLRYVHATRGVDFEALGNVWASAWDCNC